MLSACVLFKVRRGVCLMEQASARASARREAVAKRVEGSFAIARKMTSESAAGICGLMSMGGVGSV